MIEKNYHRSNDRNRKTCSDAPIMYTNERNFEIGANLVPEKEHRERSNPRKEKTKLNEYQTRQATVAAEQNMSERETTLRLCLVMMIDENGRIRLKFSGILEMCFLSLLKREKKNSKIHSAQVLLVLVFFGSSIPVLVLFFYFYFYLSILANFGLYIA